MIKSEYCTSLIPFVGKECQKHLKYDTTTYVYIYIYIESSKLQKLLMNTELSSTMILHENVI